MKKMLGTHWEPRKNEKNFPSPSPPPKRKKGKKARRLE